MAVERPRSWVSLPGRLIGFWRVFDESAKAEIILKTRYSRWRYAGHPELVISQYVTRRSVGAFLRGPRGFPIAATRRRLEPYADDLAAGLDAPFEGELPFIRWWRVDGGDEANWPAMAAWLHEQGDVYRKVVGEVFE